MNILNHLSINHHPLSIITLSSIKQNWKFSYVRNKAVTKLSFHFIILKVVGPLAEMFDFLYSLEFEIRNVSNDKT